MLYKPKNTTQLWSFVYANFDRITLGHKIFTPGNSCPLNFLADAFFNPSKDVAAWANRSGGKTLVASILATCMYLWTDKLQSRVLSGSEDQATNLYNYWADWCGGVLSDRLEGAPLKKHTSVASGNFEILAASSKKVRGPKVQHLYKDELDEMDPVIDKAALGMLATRNGIIARNIYTSTWHRADGLMSKLVNDADKKGISLHKWNLWESIKNCPPEIHLNGDGCAECGLAPTCIKKAREFYNDGNRRIGIAADCCGLYEISDVIKVFLNAGKATWESEYLCKRPSVEGLVYPQFDQGKHKAKEIPQYLTIYRTIDWGANVFVCLWAGEDKDGRVYVLDTYRAENSNIYQNIDYIKSHRLQNVKRTYCDPAGRNKNDQTGKSNVQIFKEHSIHCDYTLLPRLRNVQNGIRMVRDLLEPAVGSPKLMYADCENNSAYVKAMHSYINRKVNNIWIDEPKDPQEFEHIPDALRYLIINRHRQEGVVVKGYGAA